jgi:hypothetical protein
VSKAIFPLYFFFYLQRLEMLCNCRVFLKNPLQIWKVYFFCPIDRRTYRYRKYWYIRAVELAPPFGLLRFYFIFNWISNWNGIWLKNILWALFHIQKIHMFPIDLSISFVENQIIPLYVFLWKFDAYKSRLLSSESVSIKVHSKNWSVVSALITAQKQCLGKCLFKSENVTLFILSSVSNDSFECLNWITLKSIKKTLKVSFPTLNTIKGVSFSRLNRHF